MASNTLAVDYQSVNLNMEGRNLVDSDALIINSSTFVPIRRVAENNSLQVNWDEKTKSITMQNKSNKTALKITLNSKIVYWNDKKIEMDNPPRLINNITYVPLRFVGESLGLNVMWDASNKTAIIYTVDDKNAENLTNNDLAIARNSILRLTKIHTNKELEFDPNSEYGANQSEIFYFPYGETKRYLQRHLRVL